MTSDGTESNSGVYYRLKTSSEEANTSKAVGVFHINQNTGSISVIDSNFLEDFVGTTVAIPVQVRGIL